jgi:hypothetical protein
VPFLRGHIFALDETNGFTARLDDSLQPVASMASGSDGAALTNGWAAIEGLLAEPGERARYLAADRLAAILACSFARAELTYLYWSHRDHGEDGLAESLQDVRADSNASLALLEAALTAGADIAPGSASDEAALARVTQLRADPQAALGRIRAYLTEALRRLYVQRNQVMHAASISSETMRATLRTTPPLVGAGIDRILAAHVLGQQPNALALTARAEVELRLVGTPGALALGRLLG